MEIRDRIQLLIARERLTPSQFADSLDVQRSSISHILNGRNKPSLDYLQKILRQYPDYDANWLILGKGDPEVKPQEVKEQQILMPEIPFDSVEKKEDKEEVTSVTDTVETPVAEENSVSKTETIIENRIIPEALVAKDHKEVEQVVIFYTDGTFKAYKQS